MSHWDDLPRAEASEGGWEVIPRGMSMYEPDISFEYWAVSHKGCVRDLNEDRYFIDPRAGVWLVADGMGGHDAGELASGSIVDNLTTIGVASSAPDLRARFIDRISRANDNIQQMSRERGGVTIGSTVAGMIIYERQFACLWAGDSRVYRVRQGQLEQVSRDHTEVQELLDRGVINEEEAEDWPRKNVITRAVGVFPELSMDIEQGQLEPGDVFVLNSDGLTAHASDEDIRETVHGRTPQQACEMLLEMVLSRGGTDNVTIVIVKCHSSADRVDDNRTLVPGS